MDHCSSVLPDNGTGDWVHSIGEIHQLKNAPKKTLAAFLRNGIEQIEKKPFKELQPTLTVGDQVWIYRDRKAKVPFLGTKVPNCVSRIMPYANRYQNAITLELSLSQIEMKRRVYNFLDFLSDLGGLFSTLGPFCGIIVTIF